MTRLFALAAVLCLSACATADNGGWTGSGAQPFDSAANECAVETQSERGAAFDACMAQKGWTHPVRH